MKKIIVSIISISLFIASSFVLCSCESDQDKARNKRVEQAEKSGESWSKMGDTLKDMLDFDKSHK